MPASIFGRDLAVDLGTANTLVYARGRGVVLDQPSVVATDTRTGEVLAVGHEARRMLGRTPERIAAFRPLGDGVIADFDATSTMLRFFLGTVQRRSRLAGPRVVVCVPSGVTGVERRAVEEVTANAGAREVHVIEEPMAAAIGAGLPVHEPVASMVVDVGGGTTEVAVISLGGVVVAVSERVAGDELDDAVVQHVKKQHGLLLGERTAEAIKVRAGSAFPLPDEPVVEIRGRDLVAGLPRTIVLPAAEIRLALEEPVLAIVDAVRTAMDRTPPELAADVAERGVVLTGGGALLRGLDERLRVETGLPVRVAPRPLECVALGAGACVEDFAALRSVLTTRRRR